MSAKMTFSDEATILSLSAHSELKDWVEDARRRLGNQAVLDALITFYVNGCVSTGRVGMMEQMLRVILAQIPEIKARFSSEFAGRA